MEPTSEILRNCSRTRRFVCKGSRGDKGTMRAAIRRKGSLTVRKMVSAFRVSLNSFWTPPASRDISDYSRILSGFFCKSLASLEDPGGTTDNPRFSSSSKKAHECLNYSTDSSESRRVLGSVGRSCWSLAILKSLKYTLIHSVDLEIFRVLNIKLALKSSGQSYMMWIQSETICRRS